MAAQLRQVGEDDLPPGLLAEGHPALRGLLGKLLDVAFVDREHPGTAAALRPLEAAARKGLSILIAPEGTRLDTDSLGPFKKRAFLIAMATGLPIVPVVIRNSESVAGRNAAKLNPGTVDIAVPPPVSVEGWTLLKLRERIEQVRAAYLETLAEWPTGRARQPRRNVVSARLNVGRPRRGRPLMQRNGPFHEDQNPQPEETVVPD